MKNIFFGVLFFLFVSSFCWSQSVQKGPYTITVLTENVYHIEDGNDQNPPGNIIGDDGRLVSTNNCSDMYLIVGQNRGLLIDLSNKIKWDQSATESLRLLVYERAGETQLFITITHKHGDHLGMLPAFVDDSKANFWIPKEEFEGRDIFPKERTTYFSENESFDLGGGFVLKTTEVPGHTPHSTIFFLEDKNLVFSGDAIGSGSGVWLFNEESFFTYKKAIDKLISYIENPINKINKDKLLIYGGHFWQSKQLGKLTSQYIYDMRSLIKEMGQGTAQVEDMSSFIPFLDANFKHGTSTISWNKEAAEKYKKSIQSE